MFFRDWRETQYAGYHRISILAGDQNSRAVYACLNYGGTDYSREIERQFIWVCGGIGEILRLITV